MFDKTIEDRISLLDKNLVKTSNTNLLLIEKEESGAAELKILAMNPMIMFCDLENKKLDYFVNHKCADYVLFENVRGVWWTHIFELKRTVRESNWDTIKKQFAGAMQNAMALAGVLGIEIQKECTRVYTVYCYDKLNDPANPARIRLNMHREERGKISGQCQDWNNGEVELKDFFGKAYKHVKIPLDIQTGKGSYEL